MLYVNLQFPVQLEIEVFVVVIISCGSPRGCERSIELLDTDRADRQTDKQTNIQTDIQTNIQYTGRQAGKQSEEET